MVPFNSILVALFCVVLLKSMSKKLKPTETDGKFKKISPIPEAKFKKSGVFF